MEERVHSDVNLFRVVTSVYYCNLEPLPFSNGVPVSRTQLSWGTGILEEILVIGTKKACSQK